MHRYAITDLSRSFASPADRREALRAFARRVVSGGVDFVQLREKTLPAGEVLELAQEFLAARREAGGSTRLLVNSRADIAVAAGTDGVHLTSGAGELNPEQVRRVFSVARPARAVVSVSCHSLEDVARASGAGADLILFGPVFEKVIGGSLAAEGSGLPLLTQAVRAAGAVPVLALGGVTAGTAAACLETGAAGVAGIRLFA